MKPEFRLMVRRIPRGEGWALDVGGGNAEMSPFVSDAGYHYVNLDTEPGNAAPGIIGDAHKLPFPDETFDLVVSRHVLEHLRRPSEVMAEIRRILKPGGTLLLTVPFMWPFHGTDYYRYTPPILKEMLLDLEIIRFMTPIWIFGVIGLLVEEVLRRLRLNKLAPFIREITWALDAPARNRNKPQSFAGSYFIEARKTESAPIPTHSLRR